MKNEPVKIILHHDGVVRAGNSFNVINQYHKEKWNMISSLGFYCGYHYLIEKTGLVIQARAEEDEGVHTKGQNFQSIGICMAGNFDVEIPTWQQQASLGLLLRTLCEKYNIAYDDIVPHRKFSEKSCFGKNLPDSWGKMIL